MFTMMINNCNLFLILPFLLLTHFKTTNSEETEDSDKDKEESESAGVNVIEYGKLCNKNYPEACKLYPNVECVKNSRGISMCRCNFLKTWDKAQGKCILNVFAPCSSPDSEDLPCGENMDCILDTLGIKNIKFCRCKKGYKPQDNKENIPAFCVIDPEWVDMDEEENIGDYEHGGSDKLLCQQNIYILMSLLTIIYNLWQ